MKKRILLTAAVLAGMLCVSGCGNSQTETVTAAETEKGTIAEETEAETLSAFADMSTTDLEGNTVDSTIFADQKVTLINVWNVGCTPCVREIPELDKLNREYAGQGAAVLGLYYDFGQGISEDEMAQINAIIEDAGASYTQLRFDGTLAESGMIEEIMVFPTTYVVASDGEILGVLEGARDFDGWKKIVDYFIEQVE